MTVRIFSALATALLLTLPAAQAQAPGAAEAAFRWPDGARAAVSLAYDDALDSQLDTALPTLDKYGLKASFYLELSRESVGRRMAAWRAAAARGHELGNHSLFHQCSGKAPGHDWVRPERDLDTMSVAQMAAQVLLGNTMLAAIDGRRERTYTVPCGDTMALAPGGRASYLPAIAGEFVAMKTTGGQAVTPSMRGLDPYAVTVLAPEGLSGKELIALVREAAERGTMVNFTFHGIGGDYLVTTAEAHEELVRYLAENRQTYWTDTFVNIMTYVKKQK